MTFVAQRAIAAVAYRVVRIARSGRRSRTWVVGPQEIASMASRIAALVPGSYSAILWRDPLFDFSYDAAVPQRFGSRAQRLWQLIAGPVLLGSLAAVSEGFIYLGQLGFLESYVDEREREFAFLKRRGVRVVCYFVGSDIRSPALLRELAGRTGVDNLGTQLAVADPLYATDAYEAQKRRIAQVADTYADRIFSASVDQLSYLERPTLPITYFYPDDAFAPDDGDKFDGMEVPVLVHAPTNLIIKGTAAVRAAVERLRAEGFRFEYVELNGVANHEVGRQLRRAHIVLNQFYAFIPGVFGIEGLANRCVVMMSADETIEPDLPRGSNSCWVVTRHDEVYDNLRRLLEHPELLAPLAAAGQQWARDNVSFSQAGPVFRSQLDAVLAEAAD